MQNAELFRRRIASSCTIHIPLTYAIIIISMLQAQTAQPVLVSSALFPFTSECSPLLDPFSLSFYASLPSSLDLATSLPLSCTMGVTRPNYHNCVRALRLLTHCWHTIRIVGWQSDHTKCCHNFWCSRALTMCRYHIKQLLAIYINVLTLSSLWNDHLELAN